MAASISSLGVGSNLDLSSLLSGLQQSEQSRLAPLQNMQASYQSRLSAYGVLQGALERLQGAAETLGKADIYDSTKLSTSAKAFSATVSDDAVAGSYTIDVDALAQAQSLVAAGQSASDETIGQGGTLTLSLGDAEGNIGETVDIELASEDSSLEGIRDAINGADIGVSASIINDGSDSPYRLVLSADETGTASQISLSVDEPAGETALSDLLAYDSTSATGALEQTVAARDASLIVNGIAITSQSNTVEGAIQGVTLSLSAETESSETLTATRDDDAIKGAFETFVSAYNRLQTISGSLTAYGGEDGNSGVLIGDSTVRSIQNQLRSALNTSVDGAAFSAMSQMGISLQTDGTMEIDDEVFDAALADNLGDVEALMRGDGSDTNTGVAGVLGNTLERLAGDNGLVAAATEGTENRLDGVADRMSRMQDSIDATVERYRQQFIELDSMMASLNSTSNYLTQQLSILNNNSSKSD